MTAEAFRRLSYAEAEPRAERVLVDGYGEGLILLGTGGYYGLYYLFGALGLREPIPSHPPDWVEGPRASPEEFKAPFQVVAWLEQNGYNLFVNESK
ncbi:annexin VII [Meiothermus sp. QL-1]|uniref:annexin VII n=1 Tax=Meiothermus sp. QL-1 TaxID=2058095 RepID=UPI000E0C3E7E|nr:annexin VII [Meiothermus sp. QL-1]RDI94589.1 annexin VII [Meiothermus sp. QL-1]